MRRVINQLSGEGLLSSRRGAGIYVSGENLADEEQSSKNSNLAMIFCGMEHHVTTTPVYSRVLYGIEKEADNLGFNVVISLLKRVEDFSKTDIYHNSSGFLILGEDIHGMRELFSGKSVVWVMGGDKQWGDHISYNNKAVGELAAKTLSAKGHKNLAYINVDPVIGKQRCESFKLYAENAGCNVAVFDDSGALINNRFDQHIDQQIMNGWVDEIMRTEPMPTGILVVDMAAYSLYSALIDKGIKPGRDIELITCNCCDVPAFRMNYSPIDIDIYAEDIGATAVRHLKWRLEHPDTKRIVMKIEPAVVE
jgi:DNA-binding LacI/PurR family transcriptional regulator